MLNAKGSSPAEVIGINYKTVLKPALSTLAEDTKKLSVSKLEESIALQQQSRENAKILEEKKVRLTALQSKIDEVGRLSFSPISACTLCYIFLIAEKYEHQ